MTMLFEGLVWGFEVNVLSRVGRAGAFFTEPSDDILPTSPQSLRRVQRSPLCVVGNPVEIGPLQKKVHSCPSLAASAGVPERLRSSTPSDSSSASSLKRVNNPSAAACQSFSTFTPRVTSRRATFQHAYPMALSSGVPIEPSGISMSAHHRRARSRHPRHRCLLPNAVASRNPARGLDSLGPLQPPGASG